MLHGLKVEGYKKLMSALKIAAKMMPMPRPILFSGEHSSLELCDAMIQMDYERVLIVTDKILMKLGLLDGILKRFKKAGVITVIYDEVEPDPTYDQVEAGLALYKKNDCDSILAVGGGSPIDCAKAIAARATNKRKIARLAGWFRVFTPPAPLFAIPTTAGTGSEATIAAVVSHPQTHAKTPIIDPKLVPLGAALDASLMLGLPPAVTAATGMDALTHAVEAYISRNAFDETDAYAVAAVKLIMQYLPVAVANGKDMEARHHLAMASYYAGLAFSKASLGYVHAISHNFGAHYQTPHGYGNAIVLPYVLEYSKDEIISRLADLALAGGLGEAGENERILAERFISRIREMKSNFDIPEKLAALKRQDIPKIAKAALKEAHFSYPVPKYMNQKQCEKLISQMVA